MGKAGSIWEAARKCVYVWGDCHCSTIVVNSQFFFSKQGALFWLFISPTYFICLTLELIKSFCIKAAIKGQNSAFEKRVSSHFKPAAGRRVTERKTAACACGAPFNCQKYLTLPFAAPCARKWWPLEAPPPRSELVYGRPYHIDTCKINVAQWLR